MKIINRILAFLKRKKPVISKEYIYQFLPKNPIVLEAGADVGSDTKRMAKSWKQSFIYAFEPVPESFNRLIENTKNYRNINCYNLALGASNGEVNMCIASNNMSSSLLKPKEHLKIHPAVLFDKNQKVKVVTIDDWAKENNIKKIDFLWLDLQGMELLTLKGAQNILKTVTVIYTEVSLVENYEGGSLYPELKEFLVSNGFEVKREDLPWDDGGNVLFVRKLN